MSTTSLAHLLDELNEATATLQRSADVPKSVADVIDGVEDVVHAEAPMRVDADPYLLARLFAGAFRAEKALRHDNPDERRRDVRIALEQVRQAVRDIVTDAPYAAETSGRQVLDRLVETLRVPQADVAALLGVSTRQLQRWLAGDSTGPRGDDEARLRAVAGVTEQLRHVFTGPGVVAWFRRRHPQLRARPIDWLDDPMRHPRLRAAARGARVQTG